MKELFIIITFMSSAIFAAEIDLPVLNVYVPYGFDSNDDVQFQIEGYSPSLCLQGPKYYKKVSGNKIFIKVVASKVLHGDFCPQVVTPFDLSVKLSQLPPGKYQVIVNGRSKEPKRSLLYISKAKSQNVDDHLYAGVWSFRIRDGFLELRGEHYADCFELDKIEILNNRVNTYSVIPRIKVINQNCSPGDFPFKYRVKFDNKLDVTKALFHVRVMGGQSINKILKVGGAEFF